MLAITGHSRFFLFQHPVDMRKGLEGLAALAEEQCSGQLTKGDYFIFVSKGRRIVKILYWDNDGFAVWWKQLAQGRFWLPDIGRTRYFQMLCLEFLNAP